MTWASKVVGVGVWTVGAFQGLRDDRCLPAWGRGAWGKPALCSAAPHGSGASLERVLNTEKQNQRKMAPSPVPR